MDEDKKLIEEPKVEEPLNIVEEAKAIRDEILASKKELKEEREKLEKVQSEALLSGTAGKGLQDQTPKEETPKEYRARVEKEISEGKHAD